jgi:hypothetical protein
MGDNAAKAVLIPHTPYGGKRGIRKDLALLEWPRPD